MDYFPVTVNNVPEVNARIQAALWSVLSDVADEVHVSPADGRTGVFPARIRVGSAVHTLHVLWAAEGWPDDVSRTLERRDFFARMPSLVLAARRLSPGSLERLARSGMNWVDETGAARIALKSGLVVHTHRQRDIPQNESSFAWTPAAIAVGEALLTIPEASVRSLHETTDVSLGRISKILQAFDREGFTQKQPRSRQIHETRTVADRESLLRSWVPAAGGQRRSRWLLTVAVRDPIGYFCDKVAPLLGPMGAWALTGPAASQIEAPFLTTVPTVHVYVDRSFSERLQELQRGAGLFAVDEGGRFEFWSGTSTTLRLSRPASNQADSGLVIADLPRVYADLLALGGRYEDAAGHLREVTNLGW